MAKEIGRLTAQQVDSVALKPGLHSDGSNLYLRVGKDGNRSYVLIYRFGGRQREAGLGKAGKKHVTLADARRRAEEGRAMLRQKPPVDPLTVWRAAAGAAKRAPTFAEAAKAYLVLHEPLWKNSEHARQWRATIKTYCEPLHKLPVDEIDTSAVLKVLTPIWTRIPETASRVRGRIETIIDFGKPDDEIRPKPSAMARSSRQEVSQAEGGRQARQAQRRRRKGRSRSFLRPALRGDSRFRPSPSRR